MIRILTTQFPAFGCLFDTIKVSARDLVSFLALMLFLILGYTYVVSFSFPEKHRSIIELGNDLFFSSMTMSVYSQFLVGKESKVIKWIFFIGFIVVFNIILIKMLITIVIIRYRSLRSHKLLEIQARSKIIQEDSKKARKKWFNFFLCRPPRRPTTNPDQEEKEEVLKMGLWDTIKYNWNQVRKPLPLKSKDEHDQQLIKAKDDIIKQKEQLTKNFRKKYSKESITDHKKNVIKIFYYVPYITLFLAIVLLQLRKKDSFELNTSIKILKSKEISYKNLYNYTFSKISNTEKAMLWIEQAVVNNLLDDKEIVSINNHLFGNPRLRIAVVKLEERLNRHLHTSEVFPFYSYSNYFKYDSKIPNSVRHRTPYLDFPYKNRGDQGTPNHVGGNIFDFGSTPENITSTFDAFQEFIKFSPSWGMILIELLYVNPNYDMLVKEDISFLKLPSGHIEPKIKNSVARYFYQTSLDIFRGILECIFLIFAAIYLKRTLVRWNEKWDNYMKKVYGKSFKRLNCNQKCLKYLEIEKELFAHTNF